MAFDARNAQIWHRVLHDGYPKMMQRRRIFRWMPSASRCSMCFSPFSGASGQLMRRLMRVERSNYNPLLCNNCEDLVRNYPGGAEVEMSMLFADVRGSTTLAEKMTPFEFSRLMDRYYTISTAAVAHTGGLIEKFVGDNATVLFPPGISGKDHARKAIETARQILEHTGHGSAEAPWLPVGAGVHTGNAFVGSVGSGGITQLTALGDCVNATARLAGKAAAGEILISQATASAAALDTSGMEQRELALKGKSALMAVYVMTVVSGA
jgi:adenylate cyclase